MLPTTKTEVLLSKRLERVRKSPNYLTMVIRGHYIVEQLLDHANRKYAHSESDDLGRLSFAIKVELATALGVIPKDSRPLYRVFNILRNRFAHNPFATFRTKDKRDMTNCLSSMQRKLMERSGNKEDARSLEKREYLWRCLLAMYAELVIRTRHKIRETIANKMIMDDVAKLAAQICTAEDSEKATAEFKAKVETAIGRIPVLE